MRNLIVKTVLEDNLLTIYFDNGGYIKVNNLNRFNFNLSRCSKELHYLEFPNVEDFIYSDKNDEYVDKFENPYNIQHRSLICSNGTAILLEVNNWEFGDYYNERLGNIHKFLKENFEVYNLEENLENQHIVKSELKYCFFQIREELKEEKEEKEEEEKYEKEREKYQYFTENCELLYNNIKNEVSADEFNMILAYFEYNYDFVINNQNLKPSKKLKQVARDYLYTYIINLVASKNFDMSVYSFLLQEFSPQLKSKKILLKFEAEQVGAEHNKSWEIINFSYSKI